MKCFLDDSPRNICSGMEDQLNRKGFAKTITEILMASDNNSSLVMSIEDKWGMGKTTFLSMLDYYCKDAGGDGVITFYFSPWVFSSQENLICDFLSQFADKLYLYPGRKYISLAKKVRRYSELFNAIRYIPKIGFYLEIVINIMKSIANGVLNFEDIKSRGVESVKKDISLKIRELGCRIFVFLDDIDRLPPQQVLDMMCLVKAIANFFSCVLYTSI